MYAGVPGARSLDLLLDRAWRSENVFECLSRQSGTAAGREYGEWTKTNHDEEGTP